MRGFIGLLWRAYGAALLVFLLSPIVLVVLFAFTSRGLANFPVERLSVTWWLRMLEHPGFVPALGNSLTISGSVGVLSGLLGTVTAVGLARMPVRRAAAIMATLSIPVFLPPLVLAVALLVSFVRSGLGLGLHAVVLGHLLFTTPFVVVMVYGRLIGIDSGLIESARDLGATPVQAFRTVLLPLIAPTIVGAGLIAFALSIDDFVITSFTIGGGNTLPTLVWGMMRTSASPIVNAIGTVIVVGSIGAIIVALRLARYRG